MSGEIGARWRAFSAASPRVVDGVVLAVAGLALRLCVVGWAAGRFPPADDGHFYDIIAGRIARGLGYTWAWPDGAVTYAAHYPVGYPALLGAAYRVFGAEPVVGMTMNAVFGAAAVLATHRLASSVANRGGALLSGLAIALHPGLVLYTPAIMTEGIVAALAVIAAALAALLAERPSRAGWVALAGTLGLATLVRPQSLLLAPLFGAVAARGRLRTRVALGAAVTAGAIALCVRGPSGTARA